MKTWDDTALQGSDEWLANRRTRYNASELACAMGIDPNGKKRTDLIRAYAIGTEQDFSEFMQRILERGHAIEAAARRLIEDYLGRDLYQSVKCGEEDGIVLGASLDGITDDDTIMFECKSYNHDLYAAVASGVIPDGYKPQMEQGMWLSGAEACLFAVSDGTEDNTIYTEYRSDPELRAKIIPVWKQFQKDVENYVHVEHAERPDAQLVIELPALFVHAQGEITQHNMKEYGVALAAKLAEVRSLVLVTDQDFSDAKAAAALFREQCKKLKQTKEDMLAQTVSIGEAAGMMDAWHEDLRVTALKLEKDVEKADATKKAGMIAEAKVAFTDYVVDLNKRIGGNWMPSIAPDFVAAIKSKRTYASMQDAIDTLLSNGKVDADAVAARIEANRKTVGNDMILFPDFASVCSKEIDDFANLFAARVHAHRVKLDAERARIQAEERAKADAQIEAVRQEAVKQERDRVEQEAKAKAEEDQQGKASTEDVKPVAQTGNAEDQRAAVVEHQDEIAAFMASRDFKNPGAVRAILIEFVKFQAINSVS